MWVRLLLLMFLLGMGVSANAQSRWRACLPTNVQADEVVSVETPQMGRPAKKLTVRQSLDKLKARCSGRKLVNTKGRQVHFYRVVGCWGNPPGNYLEILKRQRDELTALKRRFHVIEMTCNPSGELIP